MNKKGNALLPPSRQTRRLARARRFKKRLLLILFAALLGVSALLSVMLLPASSTSGSEPAEGDVDPASATVEATTGLMTRPNVPPPATTAAQLPPCRQWTFEDLAFPAQLPDPPRVVRVPIMMFHHVGDVPPGADAIRAGLTVSAANFDSMMAYLKEAGYHPVTQARLFKALFAGTPLPAQAVLLTFDDGYLDNFEVAVPILQKYGFLATINVISGRMGTSEYMSWDQVAELDRKGIDIGAHTVTHADLTTLSAADLKRELSEPAEVISSHLGHPVYWLCYPSGKYDSDVISYAREAGYLLAVTTEPGKEQSSDAPYALFRYRIRNDTGLEEFKELLR